MNEESKRTGPNAIELPKPKVSIRTKKNYRIDLTGADIAAMYFLMTNKKMPEHNVTVTIVVPSWGAGLDCPIDIDHPVIISYQEIDDTNETQS